MRLRREYSWGGWGWYFGRLVGCGGSGGDIKRGVFGKTVGETVEGTIWEDCGVFGETGAWGIGGDCGGEYLGRLGGGCLGRLGRGYLGKLWVFGESWEGVFGESGKGVLGN